MTDTKTTANPTLPPEAPPSSPLFRARYTHYTLHFDHERDAHGRVVRERGWTVTYLRESSDCLAINTVKCGENVALHRYDVWRPTPQEWDCGVRYVRDGTVYLFRIGEDEHFYADPPYCSSTLRGPATLID